MFLKSCFACSDSIFLLLPFISASSISSVFYLSSIFLPLFGSSILVVDCSLQWSTSHTVLLAKFLAASTHHFPLTNNQQSTCDSDIKTPWNDAYTFTFLLHSLLHRLLVATHKDEQLSSVHEPYICLTGPGMPAPDLCGLFSSVGGLHYLTTQCTDS